MAVALAPYGRPTKEAELRPGSLLDSIINMPQHVRDRIDWRGLIGIGREQSSTTVEAPLAGVPEYALPSPDEEALDRDLKFEIAYHALADRRGANATPAGRTVSRKVWLDSGADAAKWLIDRLRTEQHPETTIGIAETITELEAVVLPIALSTLECNEAKPEYATLVGALAWMTPPQQPQLILRVAGLINRYLVSPHIDCQLGAIQLTRLLDEDAARIRLDAAKENASQRLREEIEDVLSERFEE